MTEIKLEKDLQELIEIKDLLTCKEESPSKVRHLLGEKLRKKYHTIEKAIIDLQDQECTRDYIRSNHNGALFFTNTWGDFTLDLNDDTISMAIVCARFDELYGEIKNSLDGHALYTFDFEYQAKDELPITYMIEEEFGNLKQSTREIIEGIEEIALEDICGDIISQLKTVRETVEQIEISFECKITAIQEKHEQDITNSFNEKKNLALDYLDLIRPIVVLLYNEEKPPISVKFDYKYADDDMENFMYKIAKMVDDFNHSRR
jgi:hypothetical protein